MMENKFKLGDEVTLTKHVGKIVGFSGRGWPIVEWPEIDEVLVEDPEKITKVNADD
jgi:hypothetical protein